MSFFCRKKENWEEKQFTLLEKLDNYRHILDIYKKTFDKLLVLSDEKIDTIAGPNEILCNIKQEIKQSRKIIDHHYDKDGRICSNMFHHDCSVCKIPKKPPKIKSTPKESHSIAYDNIKCNFCRFVASEKDIVLLHMKRFHKEKIPT